MLFHNFLRRQLGIFILTLNPYYYVQYFLPIIKQIRALSSAASSFNQSYISHTKFMNAKFSGFLTIFYLNSAIFPNLKFTIFFLLIPAYKQVGYQLNNIQYDRKIFRAFSAALNKCF